MAAGTTPADGILALTLPYAQVKVLAPANYYFDAVYVADADNQFFLFSGKWPLGPGITNDKTLRLPTPAGLASDDTMSVIIDDTAETISVSVIDSSSTAT